jgi:hypothetical protein
MGKRKPEPRKYRPPVFKHECEGGGCTRRIDTRWRFCRVCAGNPPERRPRPDVDVMTRRVPGSTRF